MHSRSGYASAKDEITAANFTDFAYLICYADYNNDSVTIDAQLDFLYRFIDKRDYRQFYQTWVRSSASGTEQIVLATGITTSSVKMKRNTAAQKHVGCPYLPLQLITGVESFLHQPNGIHRLSGNFRTEGMDNLIIEESARLPEHASIFRPS